MSQARCWCGTLHLSEPGFDGSAYLQGKLADGLIKYGVGQVEQCPTTGNFHFQYYVQTGSQRRLAWMKSKICDRTHWEAARGSLDENKAYCTKEASRVAGPWEVGVPARQGKQTGLDEATELVVSGTPLSEVAKLFPIVWVRHGRGLVDLRKQLNLDADRREFGPDGPELWVLWGPAGSGKSRYAKEQWPDAFWKAPYSNWWDGYGTHETVILDDFKDDGMRLTDFQRLIDWYPLWVEIKGGSLPMLAKRYVITSNYDPEYWYQKADVHKTVWRRVTDFAANHGRLLHFPLAGAAADGETAADPPAGIEDAAEAFIDAWYGHHDF
nr:MAG: rep protein [Cressdnaviricota sp.]